jgi:hypothetical protein
MEVKRVLLKPVITFIDWYIRNYHSKDYIHKDMIKDEIKSKIEKAEERLNKKRDEQEKGKLDARDLDHKIIVDGFYAEMEVMEKEAQEVKALRSKLDNLYYVLKRRAKDISMVTAENKHEGTKIAENILESIGQLEKIEVKTLDIVKEFDSAERKDKEALMVE